ncbi:MAG TPA: tRNA preQ1(34) S-adenosylmethionine ribosyltransferase-isomerase QueA [Thermoanaerobaculia bacterium]|nr:tRNA preQ1(34) S-adenosylmethionine ribosyltransferase-isomerase QueA [Thermoanaerobaculia bacterium]
MRRSDFHYDLPGELIAQHPLPRGESRLMVVEPGGEAPRIVHRAFRELPGLIRPGDLLVLNDTAVFPARLTARPKGNMKRPIELVLTRRMAPLRWEALARPLRRLRDGDVLDLSNELRAEVVEMRAGAVVLEFALGNEAEFWSRVEQAGRTPLPPYIRREEELEGDRERYQTVYAARRGAVAAPTAGLHFTDQILREIESRGARIARLTLHVGGGTFKPVKVDDLERHRMDPEWYEISEQTAAAVGETRRRGGRIVAVGTTSVRALESAAAAGEIRSGSGETTLFITPGYEFRVVDALLTNFHLPESTLLMLVSAFAGVETIRRAYAEAIRERYRFYSWGDAMLLGRG